MDGPSISGEPRGPATEFPRRVLGASNARLSAILSDLMPALYAVVDRHKINRDDMKRTITFLSAVEAACSDNRQEWILLADAMGLSTAIENAANPRPDGATPTTILGPFFRKGAPVKLSGESISIDGIGTPLTVFVKITDLDGMPICGARIEVWQANALGRFENQEPDGQPEMNLRGQFLTDAAGSVRCDTIRPGAYALPESGPVADLLSRLGLGLRRPAHIQFRVQAPGFVTLTTHVFDRTDPAIDADPLFSVQPALLADLSARTVQITFTLAPVHPGAADLR